MRGPEVRVLGPLYMSLDGREIPLGTPMQRAVLGRLIVAHGQVVSTERLIEDLWCGQPPPKAASVLQVHIHTLRRLFEPDRARRAPSRCIVSESSGYALKIPESSIDAWHFEEQLRNYRELISKSQVRPEATARNTMLDSVLTHWHGPALEAFADTEWAVAEADRLTDLHLTAVELKAQAELELGRAGEVVIALRGLFDEYPGREELVRLLAVAQYQLGQQLEALNTIRRSREFLGAEFGIDPAPAVRHLETAILTHSTDLTPPGGLPPLPVESRLLVRDRPAPTWSLTAMLPGIVDESRAVVLPGGGFDPTAETPCATGYTAELSELLTIAESARGRRLRLVWVAGEAGIGKTTLAETALAALAATGWTVATGNCPEVDGAPAAWAWSEILADLDALTSAAEALGADDAFTMSRTLAQRCKRAAATEPVAILLENVHRADTATLQVLRQLTTWLREDPVLIVVTLRRSQAGPGVHTTAAALARHTVAWFDLTGLDPAGTRRAARAAGLRVLGDDLLAKLHERTGGHPLFIRELAKLMAAQGDSDEIPESIRELIEERIARLPAGVADVLRHISIWGEGLDLAILGLATGIAEDTLIDLIAAAEAAGLVATGHTGRIAFAHALIREAVHLGIPALRRGRMHWAALELLESLADSHPAVARDPDILAHHAILGASPETAAHAIEYVRAAAAVHANHRERTETVRLCRAAVELHELAGHAAAHADRPDRIALLDARCALVTALAYANRHHEARIERARALTLATRLDSPDLIARALTCWRAPVIFAIREWTAPDHRLRHALSHALARYGVPAPWHDPGAPGPAAPIPATAAVPPNAVPPTSWISLPPPEFPPPGDAAARTRSPWSHSPGAADRTAGGGGEIAADRSSPVAENGLLTAEGGSNTSAGPSTGGAGGGVAGRDAEPEGRQGAEMLVRLLVAATFEAGFEEYEGAGRALARRALAVAREVGEPELVCAAVNALTYLEFDFGTEFGRLAAELERAASVGGLAEYRALAHYLGYRAAVAHADLRAAGRRAAHAVECADEGQLQPLLDLVSCFAATMELLRGDVDLAERLYARFGERMTRSGTANQDEAKVFCALAIGWARGDLSGLVGRLAENYAALPDAFGPAYALALLHAGETERARKVFEAADPVASCPYPVWMSAMLARVAVAFGAGATIRELYEYLSPHTGTLIGIETGMTAFGPMDTVLAELAEALGDTAAADAHRARAQRLIDRIRKELPDTGKSLLRAA
ncbi:BTAD domain-containing putative transcriptional regulator [Nocardia sp. NPDC127526]|uniref:BTAD domain-containing putative transcriptional regulator n=1 Tax=Nocardia sp. NPDC127526 TaxID=3345393 RepID=UPI00363D63BE